MKTAYMLDDLDDRIVVDSDGNEFHILSKIGEGGQGTVFSTDDPNLAIKQPIKNGVMDRSRDMESLFEGVRQLPLPSRIRITTPLSILASEPGYVMQHMEGRKPMSVYDTGSAEEYCSTGSTRVRLMMLASTAATLARLHAAGIVYGDISTNNIFVDSGDEFSTWLIDPDNLRFETDDLDASAYFTPGFGAPEVVRAEDSSRPVTDVWAFSVLAFRMLTMIDPILHGAAAQGDNGVDSWDAPGGSNSRSSEALALTGMLPFVDDPEDDSNRAEIDGRPLGLPRELVCTAGLRKVFEEVFCGGRTSPWRRPSMLTIAKELQRAADLSVRCQNCGMSFFHVDGGCCPWCDQSAANYCVVRGTSGWEMVLQGATNGRYLLPERLFGYYSPATHNEPCYEAQVDVLRKSISAVRGTKRLPTDLSYEFVGRVR